MQRITLGMACVLMALWGAGSLLPVLGDMACGWLAFAPRAAAALIFTGMFFGPTRCYDAPEEAGEQKPGV